MVFLIIYGFWRIKGTSRESGDKLKDGVNEPASVRQRKVEKMKVTCIAILLRQVEEMKG